MGENHPCNDRLDEEDGIDSGSRKIKRRKSVPLLLRLIRSSLGGCND